MSYIAIGQHDHDSLQFHFFCGDLVGAARIFKTPSVDHASLWIYQNGEIDELYSGPSSTKDRDGEHLFANGPLSISANGDHVEIAYAGAERDSRHIKIHLFVEWEIKWGDTISYVIHQPFISCRVEYQGKTYNGYAYCKQYFWTPAPKHWGYRFVQGFSADGKNHLWTAEATFGANKYDYFKVVLDRSKMISADPGFSSHGQNSVAALVDGERTFVELTEKATWEVRLQSDRMDTLLRQRVCDMSVDVADQTFHGLAINETCYGTLG